LAQNFQRYFAYPTAVSRTPKEFILSSKTISCRPNDLFGTAVTRNWASSLSGEAISNNMSKLGLQISMGVLAAVPVVTGLIGLTGLRDPIYALAGLPADTMLQSAVFSVGSGSEQGSPCTGSSQKSTNKHGSALSGP
jgi:hypothetical protein